MTGVWRCPTCEAVNRGGRTCTTCGAEVPPGARVTAAVRTRLPTATPAAPPPVPRTPSRRVLRRLPAPEAMPYYTDPFEAYPEDTGWEVHPMPGGCLFSHAPRRRRRWGWYR